MPVISKPLFCHPLLYSYFHFSMVCFKQRFSYADIALGNCKFEDTTCCLLQWTAIITVPTLSNKKQQVRFMLQHELPFLVSMQCYRSFVFIASFSFYTVGGLSPPLCPSMLLESMRENRAFHGSDTDQYTCRLKLFEWHYSINWIIVTIFKVGIHLNCSILTWN